MSTGNDRQRAEAAEAALAESERRFRDLAENVQAVFWIRNVLSGEVVYVSPAYAEIWGRPVAEVYEDPAAWLAAIHPDDRARVAEAARDDDRSPSYDAEYRIIRPDGSERWIHDRAFVVRDVVEAGEVVTGMAEDVTERHRVRQALAQAQERDRAAFLNAPIGCAIMSLTGESSGEMLEVNPAFCSMLGYSEQDLIGRRPRDFVQPDDRDRLDNWAKLVAGEIDTYDNERRFVRSDGRVIDVRLRLSTIRGGDGRPAYGVGQVEEITQVKRSEREQAAVARLGRRALEGADLQDLMEDAVEELTATLGTAVAGVLELRAEDGALVPRVVTGMPEELSQRAMRPVEGGNYMSAVLDGRMPVVVDDWDAETRFHRSPFVEYVRARSTISVPIEGPEGAWGVLTTHSVDQRSFAGDEVSFAYAVANVLGAAIERWQSEEETRHRALHDPLTDLPNRVLFIDRLGHALRRANRSGATVAVLFMDLDHFKVINDSLGHQVGDRLLTAFAPRLAETLRPSDTIARFGGDEFVVLCEDLHAEQDAVALAERILRGLEAPFPIDGRELFTSATIGLALARPESSPEELIRDADAAMYRAKSRGRGRYEVFDEQMRARVSERLRMETALRRALAHGELELHFQPVVSLADRTIVAAEALLRWNDVGHGWVAPADFIPIAEESGLIIPIGNWVLEEATRVARGWPAGSNGRPPLVSVNLSARQVANPRFAEQLTDAVANCGIPPEQLVLEITESVLMETSEAPMDAVRVLESLGVRLALDDFGTGYSSLSYLNRLPIDVVKLDRSFIAELGELGSATGAIVSGIVAMAAALGMAVVAEGVEHAHQAEHLTGLGCRLAQGYLFAKPMPAAELQAVLQVGTLPVPSSVAG